LPGVALPEGITLEPNLADALPGADGVVVAVPSGVVRAVGRLMSGFGGIVVSATKGIEPGSGLTMSGVLASEMPRAVHGALSGPSLAPEVARGVPTAVVVAAMDGAAARAVQGWFHRPAFRVYTSTDLAGVELGGALKNVIAIAAGVSDGLGFGDNSKAALVTRGHAEIRRLGVACGARAETFAGLSGLGDLMVTCFSRMSRNRTFGEKLGRGGDVAGLLASATSVVEGHPCALSAHGLAARMGVEAPIIGEVHAMLYHGKDPRRAVQDLLGRGSKAED
jgi:glycerol-3-phosphate dehydrogenase (NAD(P)+)